MNTNDSNSIRAVAAFFACFYIVWIGRVLLLPVDFSIENLYLRRVWSESVRVIVWVVPVLVYVARYERTRPFHWLRLDCFPQGGALLVASAISAAWLVLSGIEGVVVERKPWLLSNPHSPSEWAWIAFTVPTAPVCEEILFRGFLFQRLRRFQSFHRANLLTAALFVAIHWPGWLYLQGFHGGLFLLSISVFVIGWVLGLLFEQSKSLWPPIVLHILNNLLWVE